MRQLPGRMKPQWLRTLATFAISAVATIWLLALLPWLLLMALLLGLALIPVLRRLRKEVDATTAFDLEKPVVDVTPWHQQVRNAWQQPLGRPWGSGWGSAGDRDPDRRRG